MGLGIPSFGRTSKCSVDDPKPLPAGNPNPAKFKILRYFEARHATAVEVHYPDATNYEGKKVMVYRFAKSVIDHQKNLDPHFCNNGSHLTPFARFEPTKYGWDAACALATVLE